MTTFEDHAAPGRVPLAAVERDNTFRRIGRHVIPLVFVSYVFAFLDRINVGYAQLQMKTAIGLTDAQFGLAAGIFFIGYMIFEVPSNMVLERIGARKTFLRIMLLWGLASAGTMFVSHATEFYVLRFILGVFEAGFFPGILLYFTYWFPSSQRGRVTGYMMFGVQVAGLLGGPASGFIMSRLDGAAGLQGWQWCFLLEGVPVIVLAVVCYFVLKDGPAQAGWLSARQKAIVVAALEEDRRAEPAPAKGRLLSVMADPWVYALSFLYFAMVFAAYTFTFWLPTIIKSMGVADVFHVGLLSFIPYAASSAGVLLLSRTSDRLGERRWHFVACALVAAITLVVLTRTQGSLAVSLVVLSVFGFAVNAGVSLFWTVLATYLTRPTAAVGIAFASSLGTVAGFLSPTVMGYVRDQTGSSNGGFYVCAALTLFAAMLMAFVIPHNAVRVGVDESSGAP